MINCQKNSTSSVFISLYLCGLALLLLTTSFNIEKLSIMDCILFLIISAFVVFILLLPSYLYKKNNISFSKLTKTIAPNISFIINILYGAYFVLITTRILSSYTKIIEEKLETNANFFVLSIIFLLLCVYSANKGNVVICRCSIILFCVALITLIIIFCGNISNISSQNIAYKFRENNDLIFSFLLVLCICPLQLKLNDTIKNVKLKHIIFLVLGLFITFAITYLLFYFALGKYSKMQSYPFYTLSNTANLGIIYGGNALLLALISCCVFVFISLILSNFAISQNKINIKNLTMYATIIFAFYVCSKYSNVVYKVINTDYILVLYSVVVSIIIPLIYYFAYRSKK